MATDKEIELAKQVLAKLTAMEKKVTKIEDSIDRVDSKLVHLNGETSTSVDSKLDDLKSVHAGIKATFEQGFADVHKGLTEIKEAKQIKKNGKQVH